MKIKKMLSQHRRDFRAIYECEHCDHEEEGRGYDDGNFHKNVIPNMECKKCGEKSPPEYEAQATRYNDGMQL